MMKDDEIEEKMYEIMHTEIQSQQDLVGIEKYRKERACFVSWLEQNKIVPTMIKDEWLREKIERLVRKTHEEEK